MEIPRDVRNIIVRKMDIDTRRGLGIFTKLACPTDLISKLNEVLIRLKVTEKSTYVTLGEGKREIDMGNNKTYRYIYKLYNKFDRTSGELINTGIIYTPSHQKYMIELDRWDEL